jgi:hypothetical protein
VDQLDILLDQISALANQVMTAERQHELRQLVELAKAESTFMGTIMNEMLDEAGEVKK